MRSILELNRVTISFACALIMQFLLFSSICAQTVSSTFAVSQPIQLDISKTIIPPSLHVENVSINDSEPFKLIDALEEFEISIVLTNSGIGPAKNVKVKTTTNEEWLLVNELVNIGNILPGEIKTVKLRLSATKATEDGGVNIVVDFLEQHGYSPPSLDLTIATRAFQEPKIQLVDFQSSRNEFTPNTPFALSVIIQNTGVGSAKDVSIQLIKPPRVNCFSANETLVLEGLEPGETKNIIYDLILPRGVIDKAPIELQVTTSESFGLYGTTWSEMFTIDVSAENTRISFEPDVPIISNRQVAEAKFEDNSTPKLSQISFNQVPKDVIVETVAVVPVNGKDCNGQTVSGQDIASFTEGSLLGLYNVVERRNLERVLDEQRLALSGILYEQSAVEAGCNVGAQGIIFTEYGCLTRQETIQLKLVDCQTSELYWSATGVNATAQETLDKVRQELEGQ